MNPHPTGGSAPRIALWCVLALLLAGCSGPPSPAPTTDTAPSEPEAAPYKEVAFVITGVGLPSPAEPLPSQGGGFTAKVEVEVQETTGFLVAELAWDGDVSLRLSAEPEPSEVAPGVQVREQSHEAGTFDDPPGHLRLVVDDPQPGSWTISVQVNGAVRDEPVTLRYAVMEDLDDRRFFPDR